MTTSNLIALVSLTVGGQAFAASSQASLVCQRHGKRVVLMPNANSKTYSVEVTVGSRAYLISTDAHFGVNRATIVGHVTEKTPLAADGSFQQGAPLTLKANQLIIQDPNTGSATANWEDLHCENVN